MSLTVVTHNAYICPYLCIFFYLQITLRLFERRVFLCKADCVYFRGVNFNALTHVINQKFLMR